MVATDWRARGSRADLVPAGLSISGLFDLTPLVSTSMNADLKLDAAEARRVSPVFWPVPPSAGTFDAWVGGEESSEFLRQSRIIAEAWEAKAVSAHYREVAGANHFTMIDPLTDPKSPLTSRLAELSGV